MKIPSLITLLFLLLTTVLFSGCHTFRGLGEDISGSANFVERKMSGDDTPPPSSTSNNPPQWPK